MNTTTVDLDLSQRACVIRGAAWLDEIAPDWRSRINRDTLSMNTYQDCTIGQVFRIMESSPYGKGPSAQARYHRALALLDSSEHMTPQCATAVDSLTAQHGAILPAAHIYPADRRHSRMACTAAVFGFDIVRDDETDTEKENLHRMGTLRMEWVALLDEVLPG
jgi:hypothetical protein